MPSLVCVKGVWGHSGCHALVSALALLRAVHTRVKRYAVGGLSFPGLAVTSANALPEGW